MYDEATGLMRESKDPGLGGGWKGTKHASISVVGGDLGAREGWECRGGQGTCRLNLVLVALVGLSRNLMHLRRTLGGAPKLWLSCDTMPGVRWFCI